MDVDAKILDLKLEIAACIGRQLTKLEMGHSYKTNNEINKAINVIDLFEGCADMSKHKYLLDYYIMRLKRF